MVLLDRWRHWSFVCLPTYAAEIIFQLKLLLLVLTRFGHGDTPFISSMLNWDRHRGAPKAGSERANTKADSGPDVPIGLSTSSVGTTRGKFVYKKMIVSRPSQQTATPRSKRCRLLSPPAQALRRSGRVTRKSTASPTSASSPVIIEDEEEEEEEEEVSDTGCGASEGPPTHQWVTDFVRALLLSFKSELSGEALIAAVIEAGKLPLNAARLARN